MVSMVSVLSTEFSGCGVFSGLILMIGGGKPGPGNNCSKEKPLLVTPPFGSDSEPMAIRRKRAPMHTIATIAPRKAQAPELLDST